MTNDTDPSVAEVLRRIRGEIAWHAVPPIELSEYGKGYVEGLRAAEALASGSEPFNTRVAADEPRVDAVRQIVCPLMPTPHAMEYEAVARAVLLSFLERQARQPSDRGIA